MTELALVHPSTHKPDERDLEVCRRTGDRAVRRPSHNHDSGEPRQHLDVPIGHARDREHSGGDPLSESTHIHGSGPIPRDDANATELAEV